MKEHMISMDFGGRNHPTLNRDNLRAADESTPKLGPEEKAKLIATLVKKGCASNWLLGILDIKPSDDPIKKEHIPVYYLDAARRASSVSMASFDLSTAFIISTLANKGTQGNVRGLNAIMRVFGWDIPKGQMKSTCELKDFLIVITDLFFSKWAVKGKRVLLIKEIHSQLGQHANVVKDEKPTIDKISVSGAAEIVIKQDTVPDSWDDE